MHNKAWYIATAAKDYIDPGKELEIKK